MAKTYSLDLLFLWDKKNPTANRTAIAHVALGAYTRGGYKGHEEAIMITPQCMTMKEFEYCVQELRKELDQIESKARKKFAELDEFMKSGQ